MTNKEKLYLSKVAANVNEQSDQAYRIAIDSLEQALQNPNLTPEQRANMEEGLAVYYQELEKAGDPYGITSAGTPEQHTQMQEEQLAQIQAEQDEQLRLNSGPRVSLQDQPTQDRPDEDFTDKYPGVDSMGEPMADFLVDPPSDAHGYGFPGTLSDEEVQARDALPPAGVNMGPLGPRGGGDLVGVDASDFGPEPGSMEALGSQLMQHLSDNKGKYALGAGALGLGGLGAYALSRGGDEEEEEEEVYA
jgi:hypothetical protein